MLDSLVVYRNPLEALVWNFLWNTTAGNMVLGAFGLLFLMGALGIISLWYALARNQSRPWWR